MEHGRTVFCDCNFFPRLESSSTNVQVSELLEKYKIEFPSNGLFSNPRGRATLQLWNKSFTSWRSELPDRFNRSVEPLVIASVVVWTNKARNGSHIVYNKGAFAPTFRQAIHLLYTLHCHPLLQNLYILSEMGLLTICSFDGGHDSRRVDRYIVLLFPWVIQE